MEQQSPANLEDQLRNMILGNVRVADAPHHQTHQNRQQNTARGQQQHQQHQQHQHSNHVYGHRQHYPQNQPRPFPQQHQGQYQRIPPERVQGFNQFLSQHGSTPAPHPQPPPAGRPHHYGPRQQAPFDPNAFHRGPPNPAYPHPHSSQQLYQPQQSRPMQPHGQAFDAQWHYLAQVAEQEVPPLEITKTEMEEKDAFRLTLEQLCHDLTSIDSSKPLPKVTLRSFGSLSSGFATAGSDMDLAIVTDSAEEIRQHFSLEADSLPRLLEKQLLDLGYGARLLSRTRVPIIKICEKPTPELLDALRKEREKWDALPEEEKHPKPKSPKPPTEEVGQDAQLAGQANGEETDDAPTSASEQPTAPIVPHPSADAASSTETVKQSPEARKAHASSAQANGDSEAKPHAEKTWTREKAKGPLDFPKQGIGIQCDINFFNPLGLHNTQLLRCYSLSDPRVRPMALFVKAWAKRRKINSSYSGTLSSYGYVLMVLHYLVNVARPPVLMNLQLQAEKAGLPPEMVDGWKVRFWRNEEEIMQSARQGVISQNKQPIGVLLRGFFEYFASNFHGTGFMWQKEVLSLRTQGGILSKQEKGWTGAKQERSEEKTITHRYLFAIEDPFELSHNVARTVTHPGIVAIRDEFRRAWRIILAVGRGLVPNEGSLFAEPNENEMIFKEFKSQPPQPKPNDQREVKVGEARQDGGVSGPRSDTLSNELKKEEAFPALPKPASQQSRAQATPQKRPVKEKRPAGGEISGEAAKAYLEDLRRKKEAAAAAGGATPQ